MSKNNQIETPTSVLKKIALVSLGLFLSLALLELGMRLGGFVLLSIQEYGNLQSIKQKGDAYRILCIGESTTQGQYPAQLEKILNQHKIGVHFSVIDEGRGAKTTFTLLGEIESHLNKYHPGIVVAMMGINDRGKHMPEAPADPFKGMSFVKSLKIYYLARLLGLHIRAKAEELGFCKPAVDQQKAEKIPTPFQRTDQSSSGLANKPRKMIHKAHPKNYQQFVLLGLDYKKHGEFARAEDSFRRAIEINAKDDNAYAELGFLYREQGDLFLAENAFKKAIELDPHQAMACIGLGRLYIDKGELSQAKKFFEKAIELCPEDQIGYFDLGALYEMLNDLPQAEKFFKKARGLEPENDHIHFALGRVLSKEGAFPEATEAYKKAIELDPQNDYALLDLGGLYRKQGKFLQAEDLFGKALVLDPGNESLLAAMASLYLEMGKMEPAKEYARRAALRSECFVDFTASNYRKLKQILDRNRVRLVCVQYPMRKVASLKKIFQNDDGIIFVDNETSFKKAVNKKGYQAYFKDMFAGDFGHCTKEGNLLLAQNIANAILHEIFKSP